MSITQPKKKMQSRISERELPVDEPLGMLEPVAYFNGPMPTGVTVSQQGCIFVNFPKWEIMYNSQSLKLRMDKLIAYPNDAINRTDPNDHAKAIVSVQSVVIDPADRLWILDTGSPLFQPTKYGGPKMVCIDLKTDQIVKQILFPVDVTSYYIS